MLYSLLNCLTSVGSLALIIYGAVKVQNHGHQLWAIGLAIFIFHPVVFESLLALKAALCRSSLIKPPASHRDMVKNKFPIVYSPGYNITACGLERMHPFDSTKYQRVYNALVKKKILDSST